MLTKSKDFNTNYLAKIVQITSNNITKHSNADKLQIVTIDFQSVITGLDAKPNDIYIYFPIESKINYNFLKLNNLFRDATLNKNDKVTGFFDTNGRVRAQTLRGEKSMGFIMPIDKVMDFTGDFKYEINQEFDTINNILMCEKYISEVQKIKLSKQISKSSKDKQIERLVEGQFTLHKDTENLRKNIWKINPNDEITISYKMHGTSAVYSNVLVKKKLSIVDKLANFFTKNINILEYDLLYSSRRVIKNKYLKDPKNKNGGFYKQDIWKDVLDINELNTKIPKGYTIYGEIVGFTKDGSYIQKKFDYGLDQGKSELYIYRITNTNTDGIKIELSDEQITQFCYEYSLKRVPILYSGQAKELFPNIKNMLNLKNENSDDKWREKFIIELENKFNNKSCYMCKSKVPEEGIVLRKNNLFRFDVFKLKSYNFLEMETKSLDNDEIGIED